MTTPPNNLAGMSMAELLDVYQYSCAKQGREIRVEIDLRVDKLQAGAEFHVGYENCKYCREALDRLKGKPHDLTTE